MTVRVRIAPSPTGPLHIGTARTALFNWLFAKKNKGQFILRIEDTDLERSSPEFEKDILDSLQWLGLNWDEGPYRQSERQAIYEKYINQLLEKNLAYWCDCTKEELEGERQSMLTQGLAPRYSGKCRDKNLKDGLVIRFRIPSQKIHFNDLIRGKIEFDSELFGDLVIARDRKTPFYNLAVVIDDAEMKITQVIRGEDHIPNTPKQLLLYQALGLKPPQFAHLPLILDPGRAKLSKRLAATAIRDYREQGYLPDALVNFMALLGWHTTDNREILSREELIKEFDLKRVQKAGAVFNQEKLNWLNGQYLRKLPEAELLRMLGAKFNKKILALFKERVQTLNDFPRLAAFIFELPDYETDLLLWKDQKRPEAFKFLEAVVELIDHNRPEAIAELAEKQGRGEIYWPLRVALSGLKDSPGPMEILEALGKKEALARINLALEKLKDGGLGL